MAARSEKARSDAEAREWAREKGYSEEYITGILGPVPIQ